MSLTSNQLAALRVKIESAIRSQLFQAVTDFKADLGEFFMDPSFVNEAETQISAVYDYAIYYSVQPKRTSIDVSLQFAQGEPFYYFPLVVIHD
jgi:hypothetical protein